MCAAIRIDRSTSPDNPAARIAVTSDRLCPGVELWPSVEEHQQEDLVDTRTTIERAAPASLA